MRGSLLFLSFIFHSVLSQSSQSLHSRHPHLYAVQLIASLDSFSPVNEDQASQIASSLGFHNLGSIGELTGYFLFENPNSPPPPSFPLNLKESEQKILFNLSARSSKEAELKLSSSKHVLWFENQKSLRRETRNKQVKLIISRPLDI